MASPISIGAPQPWPSTSSSSSSSKAYNFCTQGCSFNCPQLCIFPPPPPLLINPGDGGDDGGDSSSRISPLMAALIAVLAAAFLLLFYFTVISKLCRRSRNRRRINRFLDSETSDPLSRVDSLMQDPTRPNSGSAGLDDAFIRQITVFKYRREDHLIDGTECAVCLTEFNENENLRLMPNCQHAFHPLCIDTWLKTHSNCPLCRSTMNLVPPLRSSSGLGSGSAPNSNQNPNPNSNSAAGVNTGMAALRVERRSNDAVLMIRELEGRVQVLEAAQDHEVGNGGGGGCGNFEERETKLEINDNITTINNSNNDNSR